MPVMAGITPLEFRDLAGVATDRYAMSQYTFINHRYARDPLCAAEVSACRAGVDEDTDTRICTAARQLAISHPCEQNGYVRSRNGLNTHIS
jgi:hypothetical protein